ncbi:MAG: RNA methyltransferase [Polyangiaceae bacterium]
MSRLVLGLQPVREVIRVHGNKTEKVLVEVSDSPQLAAVVRFATDQGIRVERTPRSQLDKLSQGVRHQGVAAYAPELVLHNLDDVLADDKALIIALDEIQDPQNFGAVVRCAVAICGATILWPENSSAPLTPTTFRASAGAIEHARLVRVRSLRTALTTCAEAGAKIVALEARAPSLLSEVDLKGPTVLMVGSEGFGLRKGTRALATVVARLPMTGTIDSLNASAAASIALYEAARQRNV